MRPGEWNHRILGVLSWMLDQQYTLSGSMVRLGTSSGSVVGGTLGWTAPRHWVCPVPVSIIVLGSKQEALDTTLFFIIYCLCMGVWILLRNLSLQRSLLHGDNHLDGWDHICRSSVKELSPWRQPS